MNKIEIELRAALRTLQQLCYEHHDPTGMQVARSCVCGRPGGYLNNDNCKALHELKTIAFMYVDLCR